MINKITRENYPDIFDKVIDDAYERSHSSHRRGSNFYVRTVHKIDEDYYPENPELYGFWETNNYIWDDNNGNELDEIYELNRVEQVEKVVTIKEWKLVEDGKD